MSNAETIRDTDELNDLTVGDENRVFTCDCKDGETRVISERRVEHKCGFRPSASYGTLGVWVIWRRVRNITGRYNWFVDYEASEMTQRVSEREKIAAEIERMFGPHDRRFKTAIEIADKIRRERAN